MTCYKPVGACRDTDKAIMRFYEDPMKAALNQALLNGRGFTMLRVGLALDYS